MDSSKCDGCGKESKTNRIYRDESTGGILARYCSDCQDYLEEHEIDPAEHEQYGLGV